MSEMRSTTMMIDYNVMTQKVVLDFNSQNFFQDMHKSSEQIKILDRCKQVLSKEKW